MFKNDQVKLSLKSGCIHIFLVKQAEFVLKIEI